ncbi:MAG: hypothetical protein RLZZ383_2774 [Pseudomonadota bacterium]
MPEVLDAASARALDWQDLCLAWSERAHTPRGRRAAASPAWLDGDAIRLAMDEVDEVLALADAGAWPPVGGIADPEEAIGRAARHAVLEAAELREIGATLAAMHDVARALGDPPVALAALARYRAPLEVDEGLRRLLGQAFDPTGALSALVWPELGRMRERIAQLHQSVRRTLEELVRGEELADALQDRFITQRGDRYVLPIKLGHKRKDMGIVHAVSGSGQTVFVEPTAVITLNNELRLATGALEAEERRILAELSASVGALAPALLEALDAATAVDLAVARAALAIDLGACRPRVGEQGVFAVVGARHPLLVLRGVPVVGNDLRLSDTQPALVVSGPNTGGKTIALKTLGLLALMVRVGLFVPAEAGSRVDVARRVDALIGDAQSVHGDRSSFSAHLEALMGVLGSAAPGGLVLVDEIASGTDPRQGAAIAQAVLEALVDAGPRLLVTTHFQQLKVLGAVDGRFAIGGMQFADGRPTWRLVLGAAGESHALQAAARLGFPEAVVERARGLLGEDAGAMVALLERLEASGADLDAARAALVTERAALEAQRAALAERERQLRARAEVWMAAETEAFRARLTTAERAIGAVVADLQREPSPRKVDAARASLEALAKVLPDVPDATAAANSWRVGDRARHRKLAQVGEILHVQAGTVTLRTGALTMTVPTGELESVVVSKAPKPATAPAAGKESRGPPARRLEEAVRLDALTLDLRGVRVEEGLQRLEAFVALQLGAGHDIVFVLHGHGTGAMKDAVRKALPTTRGVAAFRPADVQQGGDAYTVLALGRR